MVNPIGYQTGLVGLAFFDDGIVAVLRRNGWGVGNQRNYYRLGRRRINALRKLANAFVTDGKWGRSGNGFGDTYGESWRGVLKATAAKERDTAAIVKATRPRRRTS